MGRELRLAFAMGGGVSLGTFSGAALSEVLKLAILRGSYKDEGDEDGLWHRYDRVVVDVFSGASAGAMALGVMLRALAHRTSEQEEQARDHLKREYGADFENLDADRQKDLVAAQVVQDLQAAAWGDMINLDKLLGQQPDGTFRDLRNEASILDRKAVESIAKDLISFNGEADLRQRRLLSERVLFACTLANISPILLDARADLQDEDTDTALLGLSEGLTSNSHKELRVFDLNFERVLKATTTSLDRYPSRWCRYHRAKEVEGHIGDLRTNRTWAKIAATAIAAGAFPFAFEPVVLHRRDYEYGARAGGPGEGKKGDWPHELYEAGKKEHPFTFVDGGTFNNEPIREAYRLSSFMDAYRLTQWTEAVKKADDAGVPHPDMPAYDRCIIFVDPNVEAPKGSFRVPVHQKYEFQGPNLLGALDGTDLIRRATFDRLIPHTGSLLRAVLNEARVIEGDKVFRARNRFDQRNQARHFIPSAMRFRPSNQVLRDVEAFCNQILETNTGSMALPAGALTVWQELERVIAEEKDLARLKGKAKAFMERDDAAQVKDVRRWLQALIFVAVDLMMDLEGKRPRSKLIAIAPVRHAGDPDQRELISLPGGVLYAFGGFMSPLPGRYEMALGRHITREFMEACALIEPFPGDPPPLEEDFDENKQALYKAHLQIGLKKLSDRVGAMIRQAHLLNTIPKVDELILYLVAGRIEKVVQQLAEEKPPTARFEFRIQVPDKRFELDGRGVADRDLKPVVLEGEPHLIVYCDYETDEDGKNGQWKGAYVDVEKNTKKKVLPVSRDGVSILPDRQFCMIELPDDNQINAVSTFPHPIFVAVVRDDDAHKGKLLSADHWKPNAGVKPLEDELFN